MELDDHRHQVKELTHSKKKLQVEIANLKDKLEIEFMAKKEETGEGPRSLSLRTVLIHS